jgi:hypothetical protein
MRNIKKLTLGPRLVSVSGPYVHRQMVLVFKLMRIEGLPLVVKEEE